MCSSDLALEKAEKKGMDTGIRVRHPFDSDWELPVYIANFILMDYGTGAIFGCPAHDQRDLDFARKYGLPVKQVVAHPAWIDGINAGRSADASDLFTRPEEIIDLAYLRQERLIGLIPEDEPI